MKERVSMYIFEFGVLGKEHQSAFHVSQNDRIFVETKGHQVRVSQPIRHSRYARTMLPPTNTWSEVSPLISLPDAPATVAQSATVLVPEHLSVACP